MPRAFLRAALGLATALALGASPVSAAGALWGLFVGIDHYKWSKDHYARADADFIDLEGGRYDVEHMRRALARAYRLDDVSDCRLGAAAHTCTLLDEQADSASIRARLQELVYDRAQPGDTIVFYYSGHGSQISDDTVHDQAGGADDTLVPYDGHGPDHVPDILDRDLGRLIEWANEHGVNVVTIFDSCNSGTATRDLLPLPVRRREAPRPTDPAFLAAARAAPWREPPERPASSRGYRVHIAAAADGTSALEGRIDGEWRGLFTDAFVGALTEAPRGTRYVDLLERAQLKLQRRGVGSEPSAKLQQQPTAESDLERSFLGAEKSDVRIYRARLSGPGAYDVEGGTLSGVTVDSRFDAFATYGAAAEPSTNPVASGRIDRAAVSTAHFAAESATAPLPQTAFLKETAHAYGDLALQVGLRSKDPALASLIAGVAGAKPDGPDPQVWVDRRDGRFILQKRSGEEIGRYPDDASGASALAADLRKIASYQGLLSVADHAGRPPLEFRIEMGACPSGGPAPSRDGEAVLLPDDQVHFLIRNLDPQNGVYAYLLDLNAFYKISKLYPPEAARELLGPGETRCIDENGKPFPVSYPVGPQPAGAPPKPLREYLMLIATDAAIPLEALEQRGVGAMRSIVANPLGQLISNVNSGMREVAPPLEVKSWGALVIPVVVRPSRTDGGGNP